MPNIWMHIEYGQQLADEFRDRLPFLAGLKNHGNLYRLGCQGPDFLLYHSFLPWRTDTGATRLGDHMHSRNCGPVLIEFWQRIRELAPADLPEAQLYFLGFLTHHLLDRNLHPYVNWKAGYKQRNHGRFEIALDTVFMKRAKQVNTWQMPAWKEIDVGSGLPYPIHTILHETALNWYPEIMTYLPAESWHEAYLDLVLAHKCLYDPRGWKKAIVWGQARSLFYQKLSPAEEQLDYLNEKHSQWRHSALYSEARTESVPELWEQALAEGRVVLQALADWLACTIPAEAARRLDAFKLVLGDRSYDTGKECSSNLLNLYAEPIWETNTVS
ncbi:zinc dependent phospholipase C family protein [Paenibacillus sp. 19GGS1-52]|uniref:zinc dependent phospholipase C family protein n=1 Tax=Paenibacillus sp. 19GGS1-52 TaxID=2758563 RepID=UPI001EFB3F9A|nr:zinc dependent phospholipase C family protein [Paenibacillus sp. 19GGS1-52]ULO05814.1 zinc dependent phospholipase C family protein [Paenibacillus sp. 19GGS1-52]